MRTTIWASMIATALLSTAACHKKDDSAKAMDKAATSAAKAQENVNDQVKDVDSAQKDVNKEQKDVTKEENAVAKQEGELKMAETDLAQARERYGVAAKQRLSNLDAKIHQIEMKSDASAKSTATSLRARRDEIASRLDGVTAQSKANWDGYKKDLDDSFDKLDKDVDKALDK
jgi:hypothetical protein